MTRKLSLVLATAVAIAAAPGLIFAEPSGLGRIHSDEDLYRSGSWRSSPDWDARNFGNETLVFNHETGQYEIQYGLTDAPKEMPAGVARMGSETLRTEQQTIGDRQQAPSPSATVQSGVSQSYGPTGTGSSASMSAPSADVGAGASAGAGVSSSGAGSSYSASTPSGSYSDLGRSSDLGSSGSATTSQSFGPSGTGSTDVRSQQQVPSAALPSQIDVNTTVKFHSGDSSGSASSSAPAAGSWSSSQQGIYNPSTGRYEVSDSSGMSGPSGTGSLDQSNLTGSSAGMESSSGMSQSLGASSPAASGSQSSDAGVYTIYSENISPERSLIAAQSPETVEAYQWPPDTGFASGSFGPSGTGAVGSSGYESGGMTSGGIPSESVAPSDTSSSWSSSEVVGTGALPVPDFRNARPSLEDVDTGNAPIDDMDTFFNPQNPNLRGIDLGGGGE